MKARLAGALGLTTAVALGVACYAPTEVRVEITTDLPCAGAGASGPRTGVFVGTLAPTDQATDTFACTTRPGADSDIGSLVIVPSGDRDARVTAYAVLNTTGGSTDTCIDAAGTVAPACIVARRTFKFIEHTSRRIPIRLDSKCRGRTCPEGTTCVDGSCTSAEVPDDAELPPPSCEPTCEAGTSNPPDASTDAPSDATPSIDAPLPSCTGPNGTGILADVDAVPELFAGSSTRLFWPDTGPTAGVNRNILSIAMAGGPVTSIGSVAANGLTSLVADDIAVWVGTSTQLTRFDLVAGTALDIPAVAPVYSIAKVGTDVLVVGGSPQPKIFSVAKDGVVTALRAAPGSFPAVASANVLYLYSPKASQIFPYGLPVSSTSDPVPIALASPTAAATFLDEAFFVSNDATKVPFIQRVGPTTGGKVADVEAPEAIAVDASGVYYVRRSATDAAILRTALDSGKVAVAPPVPILGPFADISGLVLDAKCVYFWGAENGIVQQPTKLRVAPKTP